jgi:hypothetical protein
VISDHALAELLDAPGPFRGGEFAFLDLELVRRGGLLHELFVRDGRARVRILSGSGASDHRRESRQS